MLVKTKNATVNTSGRKLLNTAKAQETISAYVVLTPQIIGFLLFSIYPLIWVVRYAFYDYDGINATFIGMQNFNRIFTNDPAFWMSLVNTFIIAYGKLIVEIPLALITAIALVGGKKVRLQKFFSLGYYMPNVLGDAICAMIFVFMFSSFNGVVNNSLIAIGLFDEPFNWFAEKWSAMFVIMLQSLWHGFGTNMLFFMSGIQNIPGDIYEAAEIDGATKMKQHIHITIPMLLPTIRIILMLAMIAGIKIMNEVMLLTNGGPAGKTNVVMLHIYKSFFQSTMGASPQYGYASAMGVIVSIVIAIITVIYLRISRNANAID